MIDFLFCLSLHLPQMPAHDFGIGLTDTLVGSTSSPALPIELHTHTKYTWSHVFDGGELDLEFRFWGFCMSLENLQNQVDPIPDLDLHLALLDLLHDRIDLAGLEDIADDERIGLERVSQLEDFLQFAFPDIGTIIRLVSFLQGLQNNDSLIGRDELLELRDTVFQAITSEQFGVFWGDIEQYGTHANIIAMNAKTPIFAFQGK